MSKETIVKNDLQFSLAKIEFLDLQLYHPKKNLGANVSFTFDLEINHKFNIEQKFIFVICAVKVSNEDHPNLGQLRISCIFHIPDFMKILKNKNQVEIPKELAVNLNQISTSIMRGAMFSEFKGTFLQNALFPLIDSSKYKLSEKKG